LGPEVEAPVVPAEASAALAASVSWGAAPAAVRASVWASLVVARAPVSLAAAWPEAVPVSASWAAAAVLASETSAAVRV
jgi:hypothetical protein